MSAPYSSRVAAFGRALPRLVRGLPWDELAASFLVAWVVVAVYRRLPYGVDFRDEAFYAAIAQRFALGDRPYADEMNLRSTGSLFLVPFYSVYLQVVGSTDGLMLFFRKIYLGLQVLVGLCAYRLAILHVRTACALAVAAAAIAYVPFSIPALSYNTVGASLLAAGTCLILRGLALGAPRGTLVLGGVVHGLACVAYPPLVVACLVVLGGLALPGVVDPGRRRHAALLSYLGGLGGVGAVAALALGPLLAANLGRILAYEGQLTQPRDLKKWSDLISEAERFSPATPSTLTTLGVAVLLGFHGLAARRVVVAVLLAYTAYHFRVGSPVERIVSASNLSLFVPLYLGLLGPVILLFLDPGRVRRAFLLVGILPAILAGDLIAFSSDAGFGNATLGLFAGSLVTLVAVPLAMDGASAAAGPGTRWLALAAMASAPLIMVSSFQKGTYWDGPVAAQTTKVMTGPFSGMYTLPFKAQRAEEMNAAIRALVPRGSSFVSFYDFPAAYLSVPVRPGLPTSWTDSRASYGGGPADYYRRRRTGTGYAFVLTGVKARDAALDGAVVDPKRLLKDGAWYRIYREPPP
jgi:hypothetical protein